jgi:hypothetical protein
VGGGHGGGGHGSGGHGRRWLIGAGGHGDKCRWPTLAIAAVEEAQLDVAMGGNNGIVSFFETATSLLCDQTENKMRCCYFLAKENIALLKMQKICAVVEQYKAPMGTAYREDCAARTDGLDFG